MTLRANSTSNANYNLGRTKREPELLKNSRLFPLRYLAGEINVLDPTVCREKSVRAKPQS